ncbi:MAG: Glutamate racemase, partial [uncultured Gemmatimonadaceae bacterium]
DVQRTDRRLRLRDRRPHGRPRDRAPAAGREHRLLRRHGARAVRPQEPGHGPPLQPRDHHLPAGAGRQGGGRRVQHGHRARAPGAPGGVRAPRRRRRGPGGARGGRGERAGRHRRHRHRGHDQVGSLRARDPRHRRVDARHRPRVPPLRAPGRGRVARQRAHTPHRERVPRAARGGAHRHPRPRLHPLPAPQADARLGARAERPPHRQRREDGRADRAAAARARARGARRHGAAAPLHRVRRARAVSTRRPAVPRRDDRRGRDGDPRL